MRRSDLEEINYVDGGKRRDWARHPLVLALLAIGLFALGFMAFVVSADQINRNEASGDDTTDAADDGTAATDETTDADQETDATDDASNGEGSTGDSAAGDDAAEGTEEDTAEPAAGLAVPAPTDTPPGAFVEATLDLDSGGGPGLFRLTGRVPDQETADAVLQAAEVSYAPFVESDLEVDDSLDPAPWLAAGSPLIGLLPTITDGTIRLVDEGVQLYARSPNPEYLQLLQGALEQLGQGLSVELMESQITDLRPPLFVAEVDDGAITLSGFVPSEEIRDILVGGAAAAYGPDQVTDEMTIESDTYTSFWMYTMPGIFQLFSPFQKYSFQVEDGVASGALQGGVSFGVDSTEITPEAAQVLNIGVAILARDLSIFMTVEGHTDSSGPDDYNQALSLARAESVAAYLQVAGISADRLQAQGAGESEPIATNDTPEGAALNRRVEFLFGPRPSE